MVVQECLAVQVQADKEVPTAGAVIGDSLCVPTYFAEAQMYQRADVSFRAQCINSSSNRPDPGSDGSAVEHCRAEVVITVVGRDELRGLSELGVIHRHLSKVG